MGEYLLMNKDKKLVLFKIETDSAGLEKAVMLEQYVDDYLLPPAFVDIDTWLERRNYAKHKEHLVKWLKNWGMDSLTGFIGVTHCLGLNDTLWVKPEESSLVWRQVSLYTNDFDDVTSKTAFDKGLQGLKLSTTSPEFTSEGSFEKCWIRDKDDIFLYKKGSSGFANAGLEMYSEYYASGIAKVICDHSVDYDLVSFKGSIVSKCKMFTNESVGFVPVYRYLDVNRNYTISDMLAFFAEKGFEEQFRQMIVLDSIIMNEDRHMGNMGFLVDNDTFKIVDFCPVFDHNLSLLSRAMSGDLHIGSEYIESRIHALGGRFDVVGKSVCTNSIREVLRSMLEISLVRHEKYNLPEERLHFLDELLRSNIRAII